MSNESLFESLLWSIIEKSKDKSSGTQYENLKRILKEMSKETVGVIRNEWHNKEKYLTRHNEFKQLHYCNGGIIVSGDDGFYMDFANWVIAQGRELFEQFQVHGHKAVLNYIEANNIAEEEYMYESMAYVFQELSNE